jgi:signal transduction histidine kinase
MNQAAEISMVQTICHELNQPLQVLCGYIDLLLLDDTANATQQEYLRIMAEQVKRMSAVMHALRQMVRDQEDATVSTRAGHAWATSSAAAPPAG